MKIIAKNNNVKKGDKFESKNSRYKYIIKDIDYSVNPPLVYFKDLKKDNKYEHTYTLFLPRLYKIIKDDLYKLI